MSKAFYYFAGISAAGIKTIFLLLIFSLVACSDDPQPAEADIAENNRGVALMGRFDYHAALNVFSKLVERHPDWHDARINFAVALLNRQEAGDSRRALDQLSMVLAEQADNLRANYLAGVVQLYLGNIEPAAAHFRAALDQDPEDAYAHYYLGQCQLRTGNEKDALRSYQTAIDLDPYLRSAYYSAAQILRRLGRIDEANQQLALFQRFENNPAARLAEFKYTRMGPRASAMVVGQQQSERPVHRIPEGPLFADPRTVAALDDATKNLNLTTVDFNQDGAQDLFLASAGGTRNRLLVAGAGMEFEEQQAHPWSGVSAISAVAWGDVDNNGLVDAYLCRTGANQLWLQSAPDKWHQPGVDANVSDGGNDCADATMVDADHDGDLDILIANRDAAANLLNNNRDGTFKSLAEKLGAAASTVNARQILVTDMDSDNDVDLVFVRESADHVVLLNDRQWDYIASEQHDEFIKASFVSLAAVDLDADGQVELLSIDSNGEVLTWRHRHNAQWYRTSAFRSEVGGDQDADLAPIDFNGDGRPELAVLATGVFEVYAWSSNGTEERVAGAAYSGGKAIPVTRTSRGSSLLAVASEETGVKVIEWGPGPGRFEFVTLAFSGKHDAAETMRSNYSGIGTQVSVRTGSQWSIADTHKHSSLPGYSLQPVAIGLAGHQRADFIEIDWSDGVYQTELEIAAGTITTIAEEQRQLGSCPVLFAWNGEKFDFVTDILGVAAQGFLVEPGTLLPPRPWERITFTPGQLVAQNDRIMFKVTEPMEENSYIDALFLESYDVPADWHLIVDERMGTAAPEVSGKTMFYQHAVSPVRAFDSAGGDVLSSIIDHDQRAMPPGEIDRRFIGILQQPESLTIEFDSPIDHLPDRPHVTPVLIAESWVELPYSQTHFAAWQAGKQYRSVSLEARDKQGRWQDIYPEFGIPGGMPRTISLPMTELPNGTDALRLSWNREIYWDRIRVAFVEPAPFEIKTTRSVAKQARVAKSGFYKRLNHAQRRPEYVYQQRTPFADVEYPTGFYTSLGEMTELVTDVDDALAIIGPGEEIHVEFDTAPVSAGMQRWYVLEARGWAKDKDMYTYQGNSVGPLPQAGNDPEGKVRDFLHRKYNTRFQSGR